MHKLSELKVSESHEYIVKVDHYSAKGNNIRWIVWIENLHSANTLSTHGFLFFPTK
jgi:hypothetical protein